MKNFFISYNKADKPWAEWVAWQLEEAGYTTILQAWDFYPGSNFASEMHRAATEAERTIAILSRNYLQSQFTQPEWAAAFAQDPTGMSGKLLPVRVAECDLTGLLLPIVYIDLVGKAEGEAKSLLLSGIKRARAKPTRPPGFPEHVPAPQQYPGSDVEGHGWVNVGRYVLHRVGILSVYVLSLAALLWGMTRLPTALETLLGRPMPVLALALAGTPLWAVIAFDAVPKIIRYWRRRRLIENGIRGELVESGYFRIPPYDETEQDQKRFERADKAHEEVLAWLLRTDERILYLTGRSGSGKSSLLNAFVIPRLRANAPPVVTLTLRGFNDPVQTLHRNLLKPGFIWPDPPFDETDTRKLLERACEQVAPARLLVVFDQFEELLIIQERNPKRLLEFERLLNSLRQSGSAGLAALLVIRSDYLGKVQELQLPPMSQGLNWKEISPFTEKAARDFIENSGLKLGDRVMNELISEAAEIEETRGLIRPITLNMLGIILDRANYTKRRGLRRHSGIGALLLQYLRSSISALEIRDYSRQVLRGMITPAGTKRPRAVADLSRETKVNANAVTGCLLILGNYGLVRRIDERDNVWEVSHDFVARLLGHLLSNWPRAFVRRLRPWVAPASLAVWTCSVLLIISTYIAKRGEQVKAAIIERRGSVEDVQGGLKVVFPSNDKNLGPALASLEYLPDILELDLAETNVTDAELRNLKNITSLKVLNLRKTEISGAGLEAVSALRELHDLHLEETKVDSAGLSHLKNLTALRELHLDGDEVDDSGLEHLKNLNELRVLSLTQTRVQDASLKHVRGLANLESIYLDATNLNDDGLAELAPLRNLRVLNLSSTRITDAGLAVIKEFRGLRELHLSDTSISDAGIQSAAGLTEMRSLSLSGTQVSDAGMEHLRALTNLRWLSIQDTQVTGLGLANLRGMSNLRELWARRSKITDDGLENLGAVTSLEILAVPVTGVGDAGLAKISGLTNLQELYIGATKITDAGLRNLAGMKKLRKLWMPVNIITDAGLAELRGLSNLQELKLTDTRVTRRGVEMLRQSRPNISIEL